MKIKPIACAVSMLGTLALSIATLKAETIWYYGDNNLSSTLGNYPGVIADSSQQVTWMDNWVTQSNPNTSYSGEGTLQANQSNLFGTGLGIAMYGFDGFDPALSDGDVLSATLYITQQFAYPITYEIYGIQAGGSSWDTGTSTFEQRNDSEDWTGGTLLTALTVTSYGSVTAVVGSDTIAAIDLTSIFNDYLGTGIDGIAIAQKANGPSPVAGQNTTWVMYSNENADATKRPGLLLEMVPEPSSAMLGALAGLLLAIRRRRPIIC